MLTKQPGTINDMQRFFIHLCALASIVLLSACSHYKFPWVYRIDVEQGNVLDKDKVEQLQVGMTQKQVAYLLGTPVIRDTFDQNRWDYYYSMRKGDGTFDRKRITLVFKGDVLQSIEKKFYDTRHLIY